MSAEFVIRSHWRPWGKRYTVALLAANSEPLGDVYESKQAAQRGIEAIRAAAAVASVRDES